MGFYFLLLSDEKVQETEWNLRSKVRNVHSKVRNIGSKLLNVHSKVLNEELLPYPIHFVPTAQGILKRCL